MDHPLTSDIVILFFSAALSLINVITGVLVTIIWSVCVCFSHILSCCLMVSSVGTFIELLSSVRSSGRSLVFKRNDFWVKSVQKVHALQVSFAVSLSFVLTLFFIEIKK